MYFRFFVIIFPWKQNRGPLLEQTWTPSTLACYVTILVKIGQMVLEKNTNRFRQCIFTICNYLPMKMGHEIPITKDVLCQVWLKLAQWCWRRIFLNFVSVSSLFRNHLTLKKDVGLHLNKCETPSPQDASCRFVEIGIVVLEKIFKTSPMYFRCFVNFFPWKRAWFFIWTNLNILHPMMLCANFGWNWPRGSGEDKNVKSLRKFTYDGRQAIRKAHVSKNKVITCTTVLSCFSMWVLFILDPSETKRTLIFMIAWVCLTKYPCSLARKNW